MTALRSRRNGGGAALGNSGRSLGGRAGRSFRDQAGQASVETLAAVPLVILVVLGIVHALALMACREFAAEGAHAGAVALLQDRDPVAAARAALPGWSRSDVRIGAHGRRVVVEVRPRASLPGLGPLLVAEASADAGPAR